MLLSLSFFLLPIQVNLKLPSTTLGFDEVTLRTKARHWDRKARMMMGDLVPEHPEAAMPTLAFLPLEFLYMRKK